MGENVTTKNSGRATTGATIQSGGHRQKAGDEIGDRPGDGRHDQAGQAGQDVDREEQEKHDQGPIPNPIPKPSMISHISASLFQFVLNVFHPSRKESPREIPSRAAAREKNWRNRRNEDHEQHEGEEEQGCEEGAVTRPGTFPCCAPRRSCRPRRRHRAGPGSPGSPARR